MVLVSQTGGSLNAKGIPPSQIFPSRSTGSEFALRAGDVSTTPTFAIFTLPKPFDDPHVACIQRNAIASWKALGEDVEVILIGNETGIAETADELGAVHVNRVRCNEHGTPLVNDAFRIAIAATDAKVLVFCNADVILFQDFKQALTDIMQGDRFDEFLAIGRRTNLNLRQSIDFGNRLAVQKLLEQTASEGVLAPIVCKEYFAFGRDQFDNLPAFAVGRGNWDNWMVSQTKRNGVPVIDLSNQATVIHQNHDYRHVGSDSQTNQKLKRPRKHCYVSGAEARENQRLGNGKHVISGSTASHRLTEAGVVKNRLAWLNLAFWTDLPRFVRLVRQLFLV